MNEWQESLQGFVVGSVKTLAFNITGLAKLLSGIDKPYLIIVTSKNLAADKNNKTGGMVIAKLQEQFTMAVDSKWMSFTEGMEASPIGRILGAVTAMGGLSVQTALCSRRMWISTTPIIITLNMLFMAETNAEAEVMQQVRNLQKMALPGSGSFGLLTPPGPSPFTDLESSLGGSKIGSVIGATGKIAVGAVQAFRNSLGVKGGDEDRISIDIGTALRFDNVIIKSVSVTFDARMSAGATWVDSIGRGKPIAAKAEVVFETYEILTKEALDKVYLGTEVPLAGPLNRVVDAIGNIGF